MPCRHLAVAVALACPLAAAPVASAWNGTGHEAVAQVAWDQLTPAERRSLVAVLKAHPRYQKDLMQNLQPGEDPGEHAFREAATWPDQVKSRQNPLERTEDHHNWHYVDYPLDEDGKAGPKPAGAWDGHSLPVDLLQAMAMVVTQLRDPRTPTPRKAIDLCWVLHLVGDIHQPLHTASLYSKAYPAGDQGGNLIHVHANGNPDQNLHSVWDGLEGQTYNAAAIRKTVDRIEKEHPRSTEAAAMAVLQPADWARESYDIAKSKVYLDGKIAGVTADQAQDNPDGVPPLPVGYEKQAHETADAQVAIAGYRLANLLAILPESHS